MNDITVVVAVVVFLRCRSSSTSEGSGRVGVGVNGTRELVEAGPGRGGDRPVGGVLPHLQHPLLLQHQQAEEGGGGVGTAPAFTQSLEAEGGCAQALEGGGGRHTHTHTLIFCHPSH